MHKMRGLLAPYCSIQHLPKSLDSPTPLNAPPWRRECHRDRARAILPYLRPPCPSPSPIYAQLAGSFTILRCPMTSSKHVRSPIGLLLISNAKSNCLYLD